MKITEICLAGGLGNQLFQYAAAASMSDPEDEIILNFESGDVSRGSEGLPQILDFVLPRVPTWNNVHPGYIKRKTRNLLIRLSTSKFPKRLVDLVRILVNRYAWKDQSIILPRGVGYDPTLKYADGKNFQVGYFQSYRWMEQAGFQEQMMDIKLVTGENNLDVKELARIERPIVVQVRVGDYINDSGIGVLPSSYFLSAISEHFATGNFGKIWLFSDSIQVALEMLAPLKIEIRVMEKPVNSPAKTLEDMRHGYGYVISNSTFGWWGAYLSHTVNAPVIYPSPWFRQKTSPFEICPRHWQGQLSWE